MVEWVTGSKKEMKENKGCRGKKPHKFSRTIKAALMEWRKESGRQKERREARWGEI